MQAIRKIFTFLILLCPITVLVAVPTPQEALELLVRGNERFVLDQSIHPNRSQERRGIIVEKQEPFAAILGCSDSRVSSEIIFDTGLGDLFIVRIAGNVLGALEMSSLEYAVLHLHSPCILVLGHEKCGAIQAVLEGQGDAIKPIAKLIAPAVEKTKDKKADLLESTIKENVRLITKELAKNRSFKKLIQEGKLLIKGGYYHLESGEVEFLQP